MWKNKLFVDKTMAKFTTKLLDLKKKSVLEKKFKYEEDGQEFMLKMIA